MADHKQTDSRGAYKPFLQRLAKDQSGNALVIMAAAVVPMIAMVGSGIDMSRAFMAKARLQQACDAAVLAGRREQGDGAFTTAVQDQANRYFAFNYPTGIYGTSAKTFVASAGASNQVNGVATATLPTSVIGFFGYSQFSLTATCDAKLEATNTDVMFVLDVTGSMAECPNGSNCGGGAGSKIDGLRQAVVGFYNALEAAKGADVQVRYGFVPYSQTVNVGYQLPAGNIWNGNYDYPSRTYNGTSVIKSGDSGYSNFNSKSKCEGYSGKWNTPSSSRCTYPTYRHQGVSYDVSQFVTGASVATPALDQYPTVVTGTSRWNGCIEERRTVATGTFSPVPADAEDLDIDTAPVAGDIATFWRPMWPEVVYLRDTNAAGNYYDTNPVSGVCPAEAKRLGTFTASEVQNYVNSLVPTGSTYHDIGMIWGTRMISPTGIFRNDTLTAPNGLPIARHIIFMTDGAMAPTLTAYSSYSLEQVENRVNGGSTNTTTLTNRHNARFLAMCSAAKARNIRVWTIGFGTALTTQLTSCADPGRAYQANSIPQLVTQFQQIATEIAQLRLTQ